MTIFNLPDLGEGLAEADITQLYIKEGDSVKEDQLLLAVETAKALVEVPSPQSGKIKKILVQSGDTVAVGSPLVEFICNTNSKSNSDSATVAGKIESGDAILDESIAIGGAYKQELKAVKATPAVRALAKKLKLSIEEIIPSGPNNTITAKDVEMASKNINHKYKLDATRRAMNNLMCSIHKDVVPATISDDADISSWIGKGDITIRLIRAICEACKKEPVMNSWFDANNLTLQPFDNINLGLAVDTEEGLFVPVLKNIEQSDFGVNLRQEINSLKIRVKSRQLDPKELQGSTIVLSNVGVFGVKYSTPIVVPPTVAILATGKIFDNKIPLSLTFNHRVITGGEASRFLISLISDLLKEN